MLTSEQCRAARGWLGWTQQELADKSGVGLSTVRAFEAGTRAPIRANLAALRHAINAAGVQLVFKKDRPIGIAVVDEPTGADVNDAADRASVT
jgi:transcriptional regulator with XRE-family HTH domain